MPRRRKPARLYLHPAERVWLIRDGTHTERTGCSEGERGEAEEALKEYIARKFKPAVRESSPARLTVAEVLMAYAEEYAPTTADPARIGYALVPLLDYFEGKTLMYVRGATCRGYVEWRTSMVRANHANARTEARRTRTVSSATARKELGVLSAAIGSGTGSTAPSSRCPW